MPDFQLSALRVSAFRDVSFPRFRFLMSSNFSLSDFSFPCFRIS